MPTVMFDVSRERRVRALKAVDESSKVPVGSDDRVMMTWTPKPNAGARAVEA